MFEARGLILCSTKYELEKRVHVLSGQILVFRHLIVLGFLTQVLAL